MKKIVIAITLCLSLAGLAVAQQRAGSLRGQVLDELGGAIVGASVSVIDGKGVEKSVVTNEGGSYTINGLAPGKYTVRAINAGFAMSETPEIEITSGTERQFDVSNTSTAQNVLTRSAITLQASSVYTFFMTDNGATPIGVLRRDR